MHLITPQILENAAQFFPVKRPFFHNVISLILSQRIPFATSRLLRQKIFRALATSEFTRENIKLLADIPIPGLPTDKLNLMLTASTTPDNMMCTMKGIGPWTVNALKVLDGTATQILYEDFWVRQRLSELLDRPTMTIAQAKRIVPPPGMNAALVSMFLWRIKQEGIVALKAGTALERCHFL